MELLWIIIIGYLIYRRVLKARALTMNQEQGKRRNRRNMQSGQTMQTNKSFQSGKPVQKNKPLQKKQQAKQEQQFPAGSTTAYLNEKAKQDAIEHAKDDLEEERRLARAYGNIPPAERLIYGDSVPNGKRCIICGYCGAENLVPLVQRGPYSCYFCREEL